MDFKIEFTDKEISPWAGMVMMIKMLEKMRFDECIESLELPEQGSNRGYSPLLLIKQFMTGVWCGANRFEHLEVTRQDEVMRQLWGFKRMAGHKAFQRFFNKFNQAINQKVFTGLYRWFFKNLHFDNFTLDIDST
ncbi:MAG: transposase, partial [Chitinophagales bacterium]|nr:transposase [Chitinophagales bacterium]